ncbi:hypothetical protein BU16DRAFT_530105 [Lophium mytilinum]|uniref:DUF7730 domain-containing protein n=1 Tax=Lophium mytilinum TaxID=390894 RepID=A0A6A6QHW2_9PEZI|nr:hypothetical protein BU16DRAFT_530105 [Lophium mytilinum]
MPRLDHSLESRKYYDSSRRNALGLGGLQITSFRKIARKSISSIQSLQSLSLSKKKKPSRSKPKKSRDKPTPSQTRPLPTNISDLPPSSKQPQSPLFRLTPELRQQIYRHVLGTSNIHLTLRHGGQLLRHTRCKCPSCPGTVKYRDRVHPAWTLDWQCDSATYDYGGALASPQLLRTCRAVYAEAIEFLYSANVFSFRSQKTLARFLADVAPEKLALVRVVHLDVVPCQNATSLGYHHEMECAFSAIRVAARLPGLRELEVRAHAAEKSVQPAGVGYHREDTLPYQLLAVRKRVFERGGLEGATRLKVYLPPGVDAMVKWMREEGSYEVEELEEWEWSKGRDLYQWKVESEPGGCR